MSRKGSANIIRGGSDSRGAIRVRYRRGLFPFLFPPRAIPRDKPGSYAPPLSFPSLPPRSTMIISRLSSLLSQVRCERGRHSRKAQAMIKNWKGEVKDGDALNTALS